MEFNGKLWLPPVSLIVHLGGLLRNATGRHRVFNQVKGLSSGGYELNAR